MRYNKLIEGSVLRIEGREKEFLIKDSKQNIHNCYLIDTKNELDQSDNVLIIGTYKSRDKIIVDYIINKTKNYEETYSKKKAEWRFYTSLFLTILLTGTFLFFLLSILRVIPFQITSGWDIFGDLYAAMLNLLVLLSLLTLTIVFAFLMYSQLIHNKRILERDSEIQRIKEKGYEPVKPQIKKQEVKKEAAEVIGETKFCSHCGEVLPIDAEFCSKCGAIS